MADVAEKDDTSEIPFSYVSLNTTPPPPEPKPEGYSVEKILVRLEFARNSWQRVSPRSNIFKALYTDAVESALEATDENRLEKYKKVHMYDQFLMHNTYIYKKANEQCAELEAKLLELKRLEYYLRYGDYLSGELKLIKDTAELVRTTDHKEFGNYWNTVHSRLVNEREIFQHEGENCDSCKIPTLVAIWSISKELNLESDKVEWLISRYVERNIVAHSGIPEIIERGEWTQLARQLYLDKKELPLIVPMDDEEEAKKMWSVIDCLVAKYLKIHFGDEDSPAAWTATPQAFSLRDDLRSKEVSKKQAKSRHIEKIVKITNRAYRQQEKFEVQLEAAIIGKRKASTPFPLGEEVLAKKWKEME